MRRERAPATTDDRPDLDIGERVVVEEPGIRAWEGTVISIKRGAEAWMVDVRGDDSDVWVLPARRVRRVVAA